MSTHDPKKLLSLWRKEKIDVDMAIGHLLQNLINQQKSLATTNATTTQIQSSRKMLQAEIKTLQADLKQLQCVVDRLRTRIETESSPKRKRNAPGKE